MILFANKMRTKKKLQWADLKKVELMSGQDYNFPLEVFQNAFVEDLFSHVDVDSWQGVVQEKDVGIDPVDCPRQANTNQVCTLTIFFKSCSL